MFTFPNEMGYFESLKLLNKFEIFHFLCSGVCTFTHFVTVGTHVLFKC